MILVTPLMTHRMSTGHITHPPPVTTTTTTTTTGATYSSQSVPNRRLTVTVGFVLPRAVPSGGQANVKRQVWPKRGQLWWCIMGRWASDVSDPVTQSEAAGGSRRQHASHSTHQPAAGYAQIDQLAILRHFNVKIALSFSKVVLS